MAHFLKYHGLGNDFIVLDRLDGGSPPTPEQAMALCDRRRGIGADGVLTVLPSALAAARMHVINSDGSVAEMCGNGLRCVARYLAESRGAGDAFAVETDAGVRGCTVLRDGGSAIAEVAIEMGAPRLDAPQLPQTPERRFVRGELKVEGAGALRGTAVSMGNPHLVLFEEGSARAATLGPLLERHPLFPARTNVEFAHAGPAGIDVVVWERGCGFTEACGTGACAVAVAAVLEGRLAPGAEVRVRLAGGDLAVRVAPDLSGVTLRGPAVRVFEGEVPL